MEHSKYLYDVAMSFLSGDEPLATKLYQELSKCLSVFVYSKKQDQLAGTDGLESFRQAFFSQSRLIVVLYRDGWGKTRWTAVEELAIKERMFNGGWNSLLFVRLDQKSTYPAWLPEIHIRLDYTLFADSLIGAIKLRLLELGGELKIETALGKAQRMEAVAQTESERNQKLTHEGRAAVHVEWDKLRRLIDGKITEIKPHFDIQNGSDEWSHVIRTTSASFRLGYHPIPLASKSQMVVQGFIGALLLPEQQGKRMYIPGEEPQRISERTCYFDYDAALGWCWRCDGQLLDTESLGEMILKQILELHKKVELDKITPRRERRVRPSAWS
jgi:hypothetical protein